MGLPEALSVGFGIVGAAGGTWLGAKAGSTLERTLTDEEKDAVDHALGALASPDEHAPPPSLNASDGAHPDAREIG